MEKNVFCAYYDKKVTIMYSKSYTGASLKSRVRSLKSGKKVKSIHLLKCSVEISFFIRFFQFENYFLILCP
jgi:hypothetical protein